ncbi:bifunctional oligoribonuclease/PAP phosphatase NrnA [Geobacter pelophilus]|uniref:Bifunctional oligoribonuclease/PAP phosphatase NrnA n=1 Tax=Geoanaerobacter pelophilus TaxID=60036 RepID=A0AAW4LCN5_9BACT|nr:bifunctional oligoribonuclease/PAP phosphatase NrnA [Geoanaerobacter pelophilus]MBT0665784.1 bifunctional oligoribonuclease/PAP phosphatase NrnA [Geoanaerobacter pelophilus]
MSNTIQKINEIIAKSSSFLITTHESPDGDAVGSSLALASYLRSIGKDVTIHFCDPVPELYTFLPLADTVLQTIPDKTYDICFVLDVGEFRRAGKAVASCQSITAFINIDHHLSCDEFGIINLIDSTASATGALIHRIIKSANHPISFDIAQCIYTAVITDTGSFRYSNSNPEAFAIAGEMIACGVNAWDIAEKLYESQPRQRLELLAQVLPTLTFTPKGDVASVTVTLDMYEKTGTGPELTDGFINYPRSIRGVEVALLFRELKPGSWKIGFRSKGKVDVASLSAAFGGGGHHNAAGCNMDGTFDEVRARLFSHLEKVL